MRKLGFVGLLVLAGGLWACGGDDGKTEDTAGTDTAVADTAAGTDTVAADEAEDVAVGATYAEPTGGATWTVARVAEAKTRDGAIAACSGLTLEGLGGWRLPTVGEARGLYRDCPDLEVGGTCQIGAGCLDSTCNDASCKTCQTASSQPAGQCKALQAFQQGWEGAGWYWTSDEAADLGQYWVYNLCQGAFNVVVGGSMYDVRCVR